MRGDGVREIVVVSGKGGTGKTTLTAALAVLLAPVCLADADVEAANLGLVFPGSLTEREEFWGAPKPVVDRAACIACGRCLDVCRFGAIGARTPPVFDRVRCEGCGVCIDQCPVGAINEEVGVSGWVETVETSAGPLVQGELEPGEDLSGKLTTRVRQKARAAAERAGLDLVLVDGPPGTGCPAIASITGASRVIAVTEPTLTACADLERLFQLAGLFDLVPDVVINKADLNWSADAELRSLCSRWRAPIAASVVYDPSLLGWLQAGAPADELPSSLTGLETWVSMELMPRLER
jgi:MinD superfamily P-loop ATPase